jgi:hypothetical protein
MDINYIPKPKALYAEEYRKIHKDRHNAGNTLRRAVKKGKVVRPYICQECGRKGRIVAHHEDYSQPFNVKWLCYSCHKLIHLKLIPDKTLDRV